MMLETIGVTELAAYFDVTAKTIQNWANKLGIVKVKRGEYPRLETIRAFIRMGKELVLQEAMRHPEVEADLDAKIKQEALLLAKEKTLEKQTKNRQKMGELHDGNHILQLMGSLVNASKTRLLAMPSYLAPKLAKETNPALVQQALTKVLTEILEGLGQYDHQLPAAHAGVDETDSEPLATTPTTTG